MKTIRKANDRGRTKWDWLDSRHTFSFGEYFDPQHLGFRSLRVINDDLVQPGQGFGTHPHRDMEILTYVLSGQLAHRDSMGNGRTIETGELQAMSAGRGITHSEFNASEQVPVHFLQIWITPDERGLTPSYSEWKPNGPADRPLKLLASPTGADGSVRIHQDARLYLGELAAHESSRHALAPGRGAWLHLIEGRVVSGSTTLSPGDALGVEEESSVEIAAQEPSRFLLFDLA
jgi:hypothetical protein